MTKGKQDDLEARTWAGESGDLVLILALPPIHCLNRQDRKIGGGETEAQSNLPKVTQRSVVEVGPKPRSPAAHSSALSTGLIRPSDGIIWPYSKAH